MWDRKCERFHLTKAFTYGCSLSELWAALFLFRVNSLLYFKFPVTVKCFELQQSRHRKSNEMSKQSSIIMKCHWKYDVTKMPNVDVLENGWQRELRTLLPPKADNGSALISISEPCLLPYHQSDGHDKRPFTLAPNLEGMGWKVRVLAKIQVVGYSSYCCCRRPWDCFCLVCCWRCYHW